MKILLLSAYDAKSHQYWRTGLTEAFSEHTWTVLTLPARHFSWRIRGNSLSWAFEQRELLSKHYDLLIVTSMTDLSALRGMIPQLARIPTLVYFHENQFAYPDSAHTRTSVEPKILNFYTALCADRIAFNSQYNRDTFYAGASQLISKLPDHAPQSTLQVIDELATVVPVPLKLSGVRQTTQALKKPYRPCQIVWNHRWEYDKGPDLLFEALAILNEKMEKNSFTLHVVGQSFRNQPEAFEKIKNNFAARLGHWGFVENRFAYRELLEQCDLVISTAAHDFQGIAVLEAVYAGNVPVVPNRLAYPELFRPEFCFDDSKNEALSLANALKSRIQEHSLSALPEAPQLQHLTWETLKPAYQKLFDETRTAFHQSSVI